MVITGNVQESCTNYICKFMQVKFRKYTVNKLLGYIFYTKFKKKKERKMYL